MMLTLEMKLPYLKFMRFFYKSNVHIIIETSVKYKGSANKLSKSDSRNALKQNKQITVKIKMTKDKIVSFR